ncbi:MAG: HPP family protein [Methylococcales bacterium]|nr:HPP family protein [Methylococcales bacterium]MBT7411182.1 HPP family protein [Methylococcales bacterium]
MNFINKMKGVTNSPPLVPISEVIWSWIGGFFGIASVAYLNQLYFTDNDLIFIIGSFGASAVLIYGAPNVPYAQPRNLVGGHFISALIGVTFFKFLPDPIWLTSAMAVATAIACMHLTKTIHPPGGATALIAVIGSENIHQLGYFYAILPVLFGACLLLIIALLINNIPDSRQYPQFWR